MVILLYRSPMLQLEPSLSCEGHDLLIKSNRVYLLLLVMIGLTNKVSTTWENCLFISIHYYFLSINHDPHMRCTGLCNNLAYNQCDSGKLMNSIKPSD
jgi:hypothetical protein